MGPQIHKPNSLLVGAIFIVSKIGEQRGHILIINYSAAVAPHKGHYDMLTIHLEVWMQGLGLKGVEGNIKAYWEKASSLICSALLVVGAQLFQKRFQ